MILFNLFPNAKQSCVTFSFDDGNAQDKTVAKMLSQRGMKATFHLHNRSNALLEKEEFQQTYNSHEVACHGECHVSISSASSISRIGEIMNNRRLLESKTDYPVTGMSYALGAFDDEAIKALKACGIVYSRTAYNTGNFKLPEDFYKWHPTCHFNECIEIGKRFMKDIDSPYPSPRLFYFWAHSHELDDLDHFKTFEEFLDIIDCREKIWYATNMEIYRYLKACRELVISADEKIVYNPTLIDVWFKKDGETFVVRGGETLYL